MLGIENLKVKLHYAMQAPNDERLKDAIAELKEGPRELVDLYNEFACPWQQWGLALEMVEIANYSDAAYVRQLWDVYLRQACPLSADMLLSLEASANATMPWR